MRTLKVFITVMIATWVAVFFSANASLQLELTQSVDAALPIAIVPFVNGANAVVPGKTTLSKVIGNDLQNSGQFRVVTPGLMGEKPQDLQHIDAAYWRKQGADSVVIGQVEALTGGRFKVSFQLVNVQGRAKQDNTPLIQQTYVVNQAGLRTLAHHISDAIYQQLTGVRGVFSTKIAYVLIQRNFNQPPHYLLEVADADGFNPQALLVSKMPIMSPTWAPDGKKIAYVSFEGDHAAIYLQTLATGQRELISHVPGVNGAPAFSPDGSKLALVLTSTGNPKIYVLNLNNKKLTQVTNGYSIDTEPSWAPDGKSLLFTSDRGGNPQIYRYTFASRQIDRLTFDGNYNAKASYLPGEQNMVMMHRETGMFGIAIQDVNSGQINILSDTGYGESPSLAPNGKMVLYDTIFGGRRVLALVSTDGRIKLRLPARDGSVQDPSWSPFLD